MANIIDIPHFNGGELNISGTEQTDISESITDFIAKYEPDYLKKALGYPLWKLLKADAYPVPVTQRFIDLLDGGVEYIGNNGFTKEWLGLKTIGQTPIANYIWYWYQRDNVSLNTSLGEVKGKAENSTNTSVMMKQTRAWNEMVNLTYELCDFLTNAKTADVATYPEFDINQAYCFKKINVFNL